MISDCTCNPELQGSTFGILHRTRVKTLKATKQWSQAVREDLQIHLAHVQGLDQGCVARWPGGLHVPCKTDWDYSSGPGMGFRILLVRLALADTLQGNAPGACPWQHLLSLVPFVRNLQKLPIAWPAQIMSLLPERSPAT